MATLWTGAMHHSSYRDIFLKRRIDDQGYVSMQQHRGMAHSEGWPFPAWQQSTGVGWHFSVADEAWAIQNFGLQAQATLDDWEVVGAKSLGIDPVRGWQLEADAEVVTITTPRFRCATEVAPFVRLEWSARGLLGDAPPTIAWQLDHQEDWNDDQSMRISGPVLESLEYLNIPLYRAQRYAGAMTRCRLTLNCRPGARVDLKSLITAIDTRQPITNLNFIRACCDYFDWTQDLEFLRRNIARIRIANRFALSEFAIPETRHVRVPWVGHEGRSGLVVASDGSKSVLPGRGVGNNYWDLLPFGGHDGLSTIYAFDALVRLAALERAIAEHPEWSIPTDESDFTSDSLIELADAIRADFQNRFWSAENGRFVGWIDLDGKPYDYGFTFVNLEAIAYGIASADQADQIMAWVDGQRIVEGDTSTGADIYRWRFAPRATTRRNLETYTWVWQSPESIAWGDQIQDGGAVLGFSYFDVMARLKTRGPDDAWRRLQALLRWFAEVQAEGGYRAYYGKPGRGVLQGGGPPGGLGLDREFLESVLVPQVMLYGFLGFQPHPTGFTIDPQLPRDWPSLRVDGIHFHGQVLDITARADGTVSVRSQATSDRPAGAR
jgi:hypothetical protein